MTIKRLAMLSVHTSPLAALGGSKTGGMNVYVRELARELGNQGVLVDIFTRRAAPDTPEVDTSLGKNVRVITVNCGPAAPMNPDTIYPHLQQFTAGVIAFATLQNLRYDFVYSHYWLSGWVAQKLKEVWGTPFAQMFHTLGHMKNRIAGETTSLPDMRITGETKIVQSADRLIAATPAEHAQLLWLYRADRRKISIIPPGVDETRFTPIAQKEAKAALGMEARDRLLLFVGRIEPLKAVDTILEAINLLRHQCADLLQHTRFAVIGGTPDNPELSRLMSLSEQLKLGDVVQFLGAKDHTLLSTYYAAAEAVIMPSDYESFGMVALEAMASGTPVIASEVGGLAFLVRNGQTGFLVPTREPEALAEKICAFLSHPELRVRMGQNAALVARQYAWTTIAQKLLTVFEETRQKAPVMSAATK